jgi:hypothetical protein
MPQQLHHVLRSPSLRITEVKLKLELRNFYGGQADMKNRLKHAVSL